MIVPRGAVTIGAVGVLWVDAVLLVYAGVVRGSRSLVLGAAGCLVASLLVLLAWRRYRRALAEVAAARRDLAQEAEAIQALLRARPSPQ